ncbi:MAG: hypothetical protein OEM02_14805 [Desulfobulbaceae bacterium]|nr:hypothetical protein [Desulfobulbaceae bacterium]
MKKCPVCRATVKQRGECRRCRADLTPLFELEERADQLASRAVHALAAGDPATARHLAEKSFSLHDCLFIRKLLKFLTTRTADNHSQTVLH